MIVYANFYRTILHKQKNVCLKVKFYSLTSGLVPLVANWNCQTSYKKRYARLLVLHLLPLLNTWVGSSPAASRGRSTCYCDRLHHFSVSFVDVTRMSMSTVFFLAELDSGILCLYNSLL